MVHEYLHRRHVRRDNPFKEAASAIAQAFGGHDQVQPSTVVSIVYVTATPTFTGAIGGYSTQGPVVVHTSTPDPDINSSPPDEGASNTGLLVGGKTSSSTTMPTAILPSKTSVPPSASLIIDTSTSSSKVAAQTSSTSVSAASATSSNTTTNSGSGGMSTAGKAGLAIGILLLLGAVLSIVLFCFKKRREKREKLDDEKHEFGDMNRQASQRANPNAPRLSLRPVTQFLPNLGEKQQSRGNVPNMSRPVAQNAERSTTAQSNRENPFGNHAETIDATNARGPEVVQGMGPGGEVLTGATAAAAAVGLTRGASKRGFGPSPIDLTKKAPFAGPPSPAHTEFSVSSESGSPNQGASASGAAIAAAGGPINSAVHRVQLDFKPSMDDELELRAGQLIRLLHEYDDGWALCIRLDRSRQGVVPRTCLSTRPVKPRPQQNGPRGPPPPGMRVPQQQPRSMSPAGQARPMTPNGQQPRPMSPSQQRPMTPNGQHPRSMSPSMQRPMTPNGQHPRPMSPSQQRPMQGRPASPSQMQSRRNSPPGPSAMNPQYSPSSSPPGPQFVSGSPPNNSPIGRKPVPGQAM
ncbi:hypothetical protein N431DRAFT_115821 [Stipitochalara longipes BDJ]|nr:hypothetical protein N431DRAFT_115821 [Stipitochalara longipes BDJ]